MRLPWPFNVLQRAPSRAGSAQPAADDVARAARRERAEWRDLPPLGETIGPAPLVAPTRPFAAELKAGTPPPPVLAPLGHGKGLDAPIGIVAGIAKPVQRAAGAQAQPLAPRRRSPGLTAELQSTEVAVPDAEAGPASIASAAPIQPVLAPRAVPTIFARAHRAPLQMARVAPREADAMDSARGTGVIGQPRVPAAAAPRPAETPTLPTAATPGESAPGSQPVELPGGISRKAHAAPGALSATPALDVPRLTLGQSRRLGLGPPLEPGVMRAPVSSAPARDATPSETSRASAPPATSLVSKSSGVSDTGSSVMAPAFAAPAAAAMPVAPGAAPQRLRPLRTVAPIFQRAPLAGGSAVSSGVTASLSPTDRTSAIDGHVRVHRGPDASATAGALDARAFTHGGEIYLPQSHGPLTGEPARSLLAHEMTHVAQQRLLGPTLPHEDSGHGRELEAEAVAAERGTPLPLAAHRAPVTASESSNDAPVRSAQLAPISDTTTVQLTTMDHFPQRARAETPTTSASSTSASSQASERDLDELARQIYGRIDRRLRRELLQERDRSGALVDLL